MYYIIRFLFKWINMQGSNEKESNLEESLNESLELEINEDDIRRIVRYTKDA